MRAGSLLPPEAATFQGRSSVQGLGGPSCSGRHTTPKAHDLDGVTAILQFTWFKGTTATALQNPLEPLAGQLVRL